MFTLHDTTCASYAQFSNSFFQPLSVYIGFANETKPLFYLGSSIGTVLEREHTRYRNFPQVHLGQRPFRSCHQILVQKQQALIQLWQPKLNFRTFGLHLPILCSQEGHRQVPGLFQFQTIWQ